MTGSSPTRLLAVLAVLTVPGTAFGQTPRPDSHTVRTGDTLWDLAQAYLGDPLLWPEIYRLNTTVVEDPHWIYPGEVLRLSGSADVAAVPTTDTPPPVVPGPVSEGPVDSAMAPDGQAEAQAEATPDTAGMAGLAEAQVGELEDVGAGRDSSDLRVLFGNQVNVVDSRIEGGISRLYRPVREDEFYSSGFLSENQKLPYGKLLGSLIPQQISTVTPHKVMRIYSEVGVRPPAGAKYEVGDTLIIVRIDREINDWGQVVVPTGLARVTDVTGPNNIAVVVQQYGEILNDQFVMPAEKFPDPGNARTVPISDGVAGKIIQSRDRQPLKGPLDVLFIDRGRANGVAIGDVFEVRSINRLVEGVQGEAQTGEELQALVQVVHVSEKTATVRIAKVTQPNIVPGSGVKQIAKLPS